jgi:DNA replication protein DnaC
VSAGIPARYARWELKDYPKAIVDDVYEWLGGPSWCLCLLGGLGTRKSSIAGATLKAWRRRHPDPLIPPAQFVSMERLAHAARDFDGGKPCVDTWRIGKMLVLDDLGSARNTPHVTETLLHLLLHRYDWELPTIITANLSLDELGKQVDERLASRLREGRIIELAGGDRRKEKT